VDMPRINPVVAVNSNQSVNAPHGGMPCNPKRWLTRTTKSEFHPPSRSAHTAPYATAAYASGRKYAAAM